LDELSAPNSGKPSGELFKLRPVRIGLWDRYGGSMPSGWTRWLIEQFEFPFTVVYPQTLDAGDLASRKRKTADVRPRDSLSRPTSWQFQVSLQRDFLRARRVGEVVIFQCPT
jgi:hypothetical protein